LIGAGLFAVLGAVAMCAHGKENCAIIGPLGAAPIGAGVGLATGALIPRTRPVYRASQDRVSLPPAPAGVQAGFLSDLALRVDLGDQIQVEDRSGTRTTGRLTRLTAEEVIVRTGVGEKRFTRETVRQVGLRRRPLRMAVLVGAGAGATVGAMAACRGPNREECFDAAIMAGALGAGLGLAAGVLTHTTAIVYPEGARQTLVVPVISRDVFGVGVAREW
jgi:hypothetical protein